jgi:hypothetical protein
MVGNMTRVLRARMALLAVDEAGMSTVEYSSEHLAGARLDHQGRQHSLRRLLIEPAWHHRKPYRTVAATPGHNESRSGANPGAAFPYLLTTSPTHHVLKALQGNRCRGPPPLRVVRIPGVLASLQRRRSLADHRFPLSTAAVDRDHWCSRRL